MSTNWNAVPIGTKVKYKDKISNTMVNGYFAGVFEITQCIKVSKIDRDFDFTNTKMDSYCVCDYIKMEDVELFEQ